MTHVASVRFHIKTLEELSLEARRLKLDLPVAPHATVLGEPVGVGDRRIPNRLCVQPMEGGDAAAGGAPGELTFRRYLRYAEGGFGLIWLEATAVNGQSRSNPRQLWLNRRNVPAFAKLVGDIKQAARRRWGHEVVVILQLSHAGRYGNPEGVAHPLIAYHAPELDRRFGIPDDYPVVSDDYLDRLQEEYASASRLAAEAGFDGVDVKACHGDLPAELLSAFRRPGRYGGSFENRIRFLRETMEKCRAALTHTLLAARITAYDGVGHPQGFGTDPKHRGKADLAEPVALAHVLKDAGAHLLNVSTGNPLVAMSSDEGEHPLVELARLIEITGVIQRAVPTIPVVGGGYSWLRQFLPNVAAGAVRAGGVSLIGVGRAALAYPALAGDLLQTGQLDPDRCCLTCSACMQLLEDGGASGCAIMDSGVYGEEYRHRRHFALDHLRDEAKRCRGCAPAPCRVGCPARIDVPAFIKAFADDDIETAYGIIREANVLPEMCAHLCLPTQMCEGPCIANTLEKNPIPIHDIQYAVCWLARERGLTGVRVPEVDSGKRVAIVGGGPAGVACAVTLVERGHGVVLFERGTGLGGTPEMVIRPSRFTGARDEVDAVLRPALLDGRLTLKFGVELGADLSLQELSNDHDAVFLAPGVWGERSLGRAEGVLGALTFLRKTRSGEIKTVPPRVILLAGGEGAVDSVVVARELGARELTIVYAGTLSEMNWHMPDSWFRTEGVHFMTLTRPLGYRVAADGKVSGVKICVNGGGTPGDKKGAESVLEAGLIIEALGLGIEVPLAQALQACKFTGQGLIRTFGEHSFSCGLPGVFAGGGVVNSGAAVVQCVAEGMQAGREMDVFLRT